MSALELLKQLVAFRSETPDDAGCLDFIERQLPDFELHRIDKEEVSNLFLTRRFSEGPHLCFCGHVDVVPAGEGWESDPYMPMEQDGYLYGRGTQDMKSGVSAMVEALCNTDAFPGRLSLLLTSDEEGDARYGTLEVLHWLKEKQWLPDYGIVAEPTCEEQMGDAIKIGRRGSINGYLELFGTQGHAAYPAKSDNPIEKIAPILYKIAGRDLDEGDAFFAPSKFVITDIRAGMQKTNVTPGSLKLMFNVRNSTSTDAEKVRAFVEHHFQNQRYQLDLHISSRPFMTDSDSPIVHQLERSIEMVCGKAPKLSTAGGTSDARFLAEFGIECVEFGVINDRIHAINERVGLEEVVQLAAVFRSVIDQFKP